MGTQETLKKKPKKPTNYSLLMRANRRICEIGDSLFDIAIDIDRYLRIASKLSFGHESAIKSIDKLQGEVYLLTQKVNELDKSIKLKEQFESGGYYNAKAKNK